MPDFRHVKGVLFADYARMMRSQKRIDWARHLGEEDLRWLAVRIAPDDWYPMESFERMGNAILAEIASSDLETVRAWGRYSVDQLLAANPHLVAPGDPVETLMRFRVLRSTYFDFEALEIPTLTDDQAEIVIHYHMGPIAEEAASFQTRGFFERLLELSGAVAVDARFLEHSWAGDPRTTLLIDWQMAPAAPARRR